MKNILAENMLRFGVKNLKTEHIAKLNILAEQDLPGAGIESSKQTGDFDNSVKDDQVNVDVEKGSAGAELDKESYITKDSEALKLLQKNSAMNYLSLMQKAAAANPNSAAIEADMEKRYGDNYYNLIRNFSKNQQGAESQNLWFRRFPQAIREEFLKQFPSMISGLESYTVHIHRGTGSSKTIQTEEPVSDLAFDVPIDFAGGNVFADNLSDITSDMQAKISEFIGEVNKVIKLNITNEQPMKYVLSRFEIMASANRYTNTGQAANMTWAQLTTARGTKVKDEILKQLKQLGVDVSKGVNAPIKLGYNSDGTSGPNPPRGNNITSDGTIGTVISNPSRDEVEKFGPQLRVPADYQQYKFVLVGATIDQIPDGDPVPKIQPKKIRNYYLKVFPQTDKVVSLKGKIGAALDKLFPATDIFDKINFKRSKYTK